MNTLTIARFTIQEAISRRLILAGAVLSLAFLGLFALAFSLIYHNNSELSGPLSDAQAQAMFGTVMSVLGLYAINFLAGFLALFLSVGAISSEIDSGVFALEIRCDIETNELLADYFWPLSGGFHHAEVHGHHRLGIRKSGP